MNLRTNEWKSKVLFREQKSILSIEFYKILETIEEKNDKI